MRKKRSRFKIPSNFRLMLILPAYKTLFKLKIYQLNLCWQSLEMYINSTLITGIVLEAHGQHSHSYSTIVYSLQHVILPVPKDCYNGYNRYRSGRTLYCTKQQLILTFRAQILMNLTITKLLNMSNLSTRMNNINQVSLLPPPIERKICFQNLKGSSLSSNMSMAHRNFSLSVLLNSWKRDCF